MRRFILLLSFAILSMIIILVSGMTAGVRFQTAVYRAITGGIFVGLITYGIYFFVKNYLLSLLLKKYATTKEWVSPSEEEITTTSKERSKNKNTHKASKSAKKNEEDSTETEKEQEKVFTPLDIKDSSKTDTQEEQAQSSEDV